MAVLRPSCFARNDASSWTYTLDNHRIPSEKTQSEVAARQLEAVVPLLPATLLLLADGGYGNATPAHREAKTGASRVARREVSTARTRVHSGNGRREFPLRHRRGERCQELFGSWVRPPVPTSWLFARAAKGSESHLRNEIQNRLQGKKQDRRGCLNVNLNKKCLIPKIGIRRVEHSHFFAYFAGRQSH